MCIMIHYLETSRKYLDIYLNYSILIELIWTITPAIILMLIAFLSFKLLYLMDDVNHSSMLMILLCLF